MIQNQYWHISSPDPGHTLRQLGPGNASMLALHTRLIGIDAATTEQGVTVHLRIQAAKRLEISTVSRKIMTSLARRCHIPLDQVKLVSLDIEPTNRNLTKETGRSPMTLRPASGHARA